MLYSYINNTNLKASKLILGTDRFGSAISEEESFEILDYFINAGGNILDTASFYANWLDMGESLSEKTIGKWVEARNNRDKVIISTKGGHFNHITLEPRVTLECVRDDFNKSLENLRTDYIDIYWLHKDDTNQSPEAIIEMLNKVANNKHSKYFGVSNWSYDRIKKANDHAKKNGLRPIIATQIQHSIAKVNNVADGIFVMTDDEYKKYEKDDLNVFGFSSQAKGFFAIMADAGEDKLPQSTKDEFYNERNLAILERIKEFSKNKCVGVPAVVLAALISDTKINTFAQIGPQNVNELKASLTAMEFEITPEERAELLK